jgi:hypothetical protein
MKVSGFSSTRTGPRIHVGLPVLLRSGWEDSEEAKASIVDISERGLSVHWHGPLRLGMEVKVILESAPDDVKVYRVVWVREAESSEHGFDIGLELKPHQPGAMPQ